jgi:hypothetical protein
MHLADYSIVISNDLHVIITDNDSGSRPSVTNSASAVIADLDSKLGGLRSRRVFYRDTARRFDELLHQAGVFTGFAPCCASQQAFLQRLHAK